MEKRGELEGVVLTKAESVGGNREFEVASHWLGCCGTRRKTFLSPLGILKSSSSAGNRELAEVVRAHELPLLGFLTTLKTFPFLNFHPSSITPSSLPLSLFLSFLHSRALIQEVRKLPEYVVDFTAWEGMDKEEEPGDPLVFLRWCQHLV